MLIGNIAEQVCETGELDGHDMIANYAYLEHANSG